MSKFLAALALLQTLAIAFLATRIIEFDERLKRTEEAAALRTDVAQTAPPQFIPPDAIIAEAAPKSAEAELMRRIIREEFAVALRGGNPASAPAPAAYQVADPRVTDAARRNFDRLVSRGKVETKDLELYLDKIAELPPADRTKALRELTKAMNDGRIEGRF